jgi:8-oxo-dGTP diphosphatase
VEVELIRLLCVTDHVLPEEEQHRVAPAYLGRIDSGEARNCQPLIKHARLRWFELGSIPENLTITASNALEAYMRQRGLFEA